MDLYMVRFKESTRFPDGRMMDKVHLGNTRDERTYSIVWVEKIRMVRVGSLLPKDQRKEEMWPLFIPVENIASFTPQPGSMVTEKTRKIVKDAETTVGKAA